MLGLLKTCVWQEDGEGKKTAEHGIHIPTFSSYLINSKFTPARSARACSSVLRKLSCVCASLTRYVGMFGPVLVVSVW